MTLLSEATSRLHKFPPAASYLGRAVFGLGGGTGAGPVVVAAGGSGELVTTEDGTTWTARTSGTTSIISSVEWCADRFLSSDKATIRESTDGISWSSLGSQPSTSNNLNTISQIGERTFIGAENGQVFYSDDLGGGWTQVDTGNANNNEGIESLGDQTVVAVSDGQGSVSNDLGETWSGPTSHGITAEGAASNGSDLVVVVGTSGAIVTSPDGTTWTSRTSNTADHLRQVSYGNGLWIAVGDNGTVVTSPDGITWTVQTSGLSEGLKSSIYSSLLSVWLVGGGDFSGDILSSEDGVTWSSVFTGSNTIYAIG